MPRNVRVSVQFHQLFLIGYYHTASECLLEMELNVYSLIKILGVNCNKI